MKNNRYMVLGIMAKNSNWNADFNNRPRMDAKGNYKASPYCLGYVIKNQWKNRGERVFGIKTYQEDGSCTTLPQRYCILFGEEDKKAEINTIRNNLFTCKDMLNFGMAYTGSKQVTARGVVQFTDGENKYSDSELLEEEMLSPYGLVKESKGKKKSDGNEEEGTQTKTSTLGLRCILDEAHFLYSGTVFPREYDEYVNDEFKGYTDEDYEDFKNIALIAVSNYNSKTKAGCKNEFGLFVTVKEDQNYKIDLASLTDYIKVYKNDEDTKIVYDLTEVNQLLKDMESDIENVEVYYNPRTVEITEITTTNTKIFDLITRKEL